MASTRSTPRTETLGRDTVPRSAGTNFGRRVRQDWATDRDFRILSIDGGGIRGILPLAALARLERDNLQGESIANYFDLIAGTSTGGIIALGFASGLTAQEILGIYLDRGCEVFPPLGPVKRAIKGKAQYLINRCDSEALYKLIDSVVGDNALWQSKVRLCIPAAETRHFEPFIFKTPHHPDYRKDWSLSMAHIAKTTSAAPGHFKPIAASDGYEFIDGGVWANNPIMVAVADALSCFNICREQLNILSLGCGRSRYEMGWARRKFGGLLSWTNLIFETMEIQSQNVVGQARLIAGGDRVLRIDAPPPLTPIALWDWERAAAELPQIGEHLVKSMGTVPVDRFLRSRAARFTPIYSPAQSPNGG